MSPDFVKMSFRADLELGEEYQRRFTYLIEWDECKIAQGNFKDWDIAIKHKGEDIFFEVKCDRRALTSGNLAIEFMCNGVPSGVSATKADYWIHFVKGEPTYYMIPIEELRLMIQNKRYDRIVRGGDGYRSEMYLFQRSEFSDFREQIPTCFLNEYKW
jgi:hypothetical protein